ncbi:hypothetical protein [Mucilaginibacter sp. CSA2-8R]|uniref:hypothetical protein n=1 Tax=Mucilaginibacter sp. CSA2-8R TaxID=3141542 RepID=UPI00315CC016
MKRHVLSLTFAVLIPAVLLSLTLNDDGLNKLISNIEHYQETHPQEKIHLQFDKPQYAAHDTMWFKGYIVNAEENKLSALSKVVYVEAINEQDYVCKRLILPVTNGLFSGDIDLESTVFLTGNYRLRAYTKWMQNFPADYFFDKLIKIENDATGNATNAKAIAEDNKLTNSNLPNRTPGDRVNVQNEDLDVQFFPEGGNLINGLRSRLAFKMTAANGLGYNTEGYIEDTQHHKITDINAEHFGMGIFVLVPQNGITYQAVIKLSNGTSKAYQLPAAQAQGYTLSVSHVNQGTPNAANNALSVRVQSSIKSASGQPLTLLAQANGVVKLVSKVNLDGNGTYSTLVPEFKLPLGLVQFTLFDADYAPLAQRLIFVNKDGLLNASLATNQPVYGKRQKVDLQLKVNDNNNSPVVGAFSVAVTTQNKETTINDETTIKSNLLLTSDIKGFVEQPNYYFNYKNESEASAKMKQMDLLMLTQGWTRFAWKDLQQDNYAELKYKPEQSLVLKGRVMSLKNEPYSGVGINLFAPSQLMLRDTVADSKGFFEFSDLDIADTVNFIVRTKAPKAGKNIKILIDDDVPAVSNIKFRKVAPFMLTAPLTSLSNGGNDRPNQAVQESTLKKGVLLKEVRVKLRMPPVIPNSIADPLIRPDIVLTEEQTKGKSDVARLLFGKHGGVKIANNWIFGTAPPRGNNPPEGKMLVYLDGLLTDNLDAVSANNLAGIQVYRHGPQATQITLQHGVGGGFLPDFTPLEEEGYYGVVVLTTNRKSGRDIKAAPGLLNVKGLGYAVIKDFYLPKYDAPNVDRKADHRSTIFWKPDIITNDKGEVNLSFYTADTLGKYLVTLEGLDVKGNLVRNTYSFEVK